ncbi:MAG: hypothetical protein Q9190_007885 [Brigantiaea leucoxantha]
MPAPLAKGIVVSISLLLAAGLAVYEHPQVRQWVDESRRKIAIALHSLGDEVDTSSSSRRNSARDASTQEDESAEAVERRRQARQEILERGRMMEEKRRARQSDATKSKSFDDLVDGEGKLKDDVLQATSTAAEPQPEPAGLRSRNTEGAALGSIFANPFNDETYTESSFTTASPIATSPHRSRSSSVATLPASTIPPPVPPKEPLPLPPVPPKEPLTESYPRPQAMPPSQSPPRLLIDTDEASNHPSEALVDLTPTTSTSSNAADLSELQHPQHQVQSQTNYWSVHEWAENNSHHDFYTPPRSETSRSTVAVDDEGQRSDAEPENEDRQSETSSGEQVSRAGSINDIDFLSEAGTISTPGSWTEVGSVVSEDY